MMPTRRHIDECLSSPRSAALKTALRCINDNNSIPSVEPTTMPPKGGSTKLAPPRLPPLPKLRVRRPNRPGENPCVGIMTSVLGCWASSGNVAAHCQHLEQSLRACMDAPREKTGKKNTINYHLMRLYPKIKGPTKQGK
ncbi:hypothetical protein HO133_002336 [Letharia lupina]|uniref:37S ribosomal protein mrp10, mitochondrial n=1 Tax=Letharia lupina TaxID=560253 RepID=A0A8H6FAQ5_9LECA|nr:uncharacterized protein HO133_002336 [Letharia lupina]KAF6221480.1 hypothetical protein HO133_002336 [Letharia lupina]